MTDPTPPVQGAGEALTYNAPLSAQTAARLLADATAHGPQTITDFGCGWGELLAQALELCPGARGLGVDVHEPDIARARAAALERGIADRVTYSAGKATSVTDPADLLISIGAFHAFGDIPTALGELRRRLSPGGRALFACEYWVRTPTADELAHMWEGTTEAECLYLPQIVEAAHFADWHVLGMHDSTRSELDAFELGHLRPRQEWAIAHPEDPLGDELRESVVSWMRGHRIPFGFVTFVLG